MTTFRTTAPTLLALLGLVSFGSNARAQVFEKTTGNQSWNTNANWGPGAPQPFPNASGATATIPAPTGNLSIALGEPITLGSLTITKSTTATFNTTITGTAPNGLTFDDGGAIITTASFETGAGVAIIAAPVSFNGPLTITQGDDDVLRFTGALSGSGDVTLNRDTNGTEVVAFNAANTYGGSTTIVGNAGTNYHVLRLNHANAIPGGIGATGGTSNITLTSSAIVGLSSTDFKRSIGTEPDQIQFVDPLNSGFASYNGTRVVNIGGASAVLDWAASGIDQLTLGAPTATGTIDFQNPLNLGDAANRNVRVVAGIGPAEIDAVISGSITSTGAANNFTKVGGGTLSLQAANSYTGATNINGGALIVNHPQAIPAGSNILISGVAVLGLGLADLEANLGTEPGQVQFTADGNGGFAAYNGDRKVTLNGGAGLTWGQGSFIGDARNFILSFEGSDGLLEFTNPIDLNGDIRTLAGRDGAAKIDSRISGVISGDGGILKTQAGTLELSTANTYTGVTTTQGGVLLLTNANSIPGGINGGSTANITLNGAALGLGHGDFTAPLGTGPGQVQFNAGISAGFAAFGGDRVVNLGGAGAQVAWASGGFASDNLILNWESADSLLEFVNAIDLNGGVRTLAGRDGSARIDSRISGAISGDGGIIKTQGGTLELSAANTYIGTTQVNAGVLLLTNANSIPGGISGAGQANIILNGGALGLGQGNFTAPLGTGAGQVQFTSGANGGFAAFGGNRVVNLGGAGAQVAWGSNGFVSGNLILNWESADGLVDFVNSIDLNGGARTLAGRDGTADIDSRLSGVISGAGSIVKTQSGTLELTAANAYDGGTTINAGRLLVNNSTGSGVGTGNVTVNAGTLGGTGFVGSSADASNVVVNAAGRVAPGASVGTLSVFGNVTWNTGSFFDVELTGTTPGTQFDGLAINGAATLAGTLSIELLAGFNPSAGATFEVLSATGGVTGTFSEIASTGSVSWQAVYGANSVSIVAGVSNDLAADFTLDGKVDGDDLAKWTTGFGLAAGALKTNGNSDVDQDVDGVDFLTWQRQVGSGPGATTSASPVPEPAAWALVGLAAATYGSRRVRRLVRSLAGKK